MLVRVTSWRWSGAQSDPLRPAPLSEGFCFKCLLTDPVPDSRRLNAGVLCTGQGGFASLSDSLTCLTALLGTRTSTFLVENSKYTQKQLQRYFSIANILPH